MDSKDSVDSGQGNLQRNPVAGNSPEPVRYINRRTGQVEIEKIYGEDWLRWTYETPMGRLALKLGISRKWVSRWYGRRMDDPKTVSKIAPFIEEYGLDPATFEKSVDAFVSFNDFFYRKLKPEARPVDADPDSVTFPADGRHWCAENISSSDLFAIKGHRLNLAQLVGHDTELARRFQGGSVMISRLCPVDYHRFHFPVDGQPGRPRRMEGPLFSVNPIALLKRPTIWWENAREMTLIESPNAGGVLYFEIGATMVGSIQQTFNPETAVKKGDEKGCFAFGGSCVMLIFEPRRIRFDKDLLENSARGMETYALFGEHSARVIR